MNLIALDDFTVDCAQFYCAEIVLALNAIHSMGFVHRYRGNICFIIT